MVLRGTKGRFIPAYAGNTIEEGVPLPERYGSSPLTRGTQAAPLSFPRFRRFIPAYAGNTFSAMVARCFGAVHPRLRGEHRCARRAGTSMAGSSPLTRGTLVAGVSHDHGYRFIPAYAGNTSTAIRRVVASSVHPRLRGEHWVNAAEELAVSGSSPLTRGTRTGRFKREADWRFIPAYAGNTSSSSWSTRK